MINEVEQKEIKEVLEAMKQFNEEEIEMLFDIGKRMLVDEEYKPFIVRETEKLKNGNIFIK